MKKMQFLVFTFLFAGMVSAQVIEGTNLVANGEVLSSVTVANKKFIGGNFTAIGADTGHASALHPNTGNAYSAFPKINGVVQRISPDGFGGVYVVGNFSLVGNVSVNNIAHIRADFSVDDNFLPSVDGEIRAVALARGIVFIGGIFSSVNGHPCTQIAGLRQQDGKLLWAPELSRDQNDGKPTVLDIATTRKGIAVSGSFNQVYNYNRRGFAFFDFEGQLTNLVIDLNDQYDTTACLGGGDSGLRVAVRTRKNGSMFAGVIVKIDLRNNRTVWTKETESPVSVLEFYRTILYTNARRVIGNVANGGEVLYGTAFDDASGDIQNWNPKTNGVITGMSAGYGVIYLSGYFSRVAGTDRPFAASVTSYSGELLPWDAGVNSYAQCVLFSQNNNVYVGGYFTGVGAKKRTYFAEIDLDTGSLTDYAPNPDGSVTLLLKDTGLVFAFGGFAHWAGLNLAGGVSFNAYNDQLGTFHPPRTFGTIWAGVISEGRIFLGGDFSYFRSPDGSYITRQNLAALNEASGEVDYSFGAYADNIVYQMQLEGNLLHIKGLFTSVNSVPRSREALLTTQGSLQ